MTGSEPVTPILHDQLVADLRRLGLLSGMTVLVHASLSRVGWIIGGTQTMVEALLETLGPSGTLMMPTHSSEWSEPSRWRNPPVPAESFDAVRAAMPPWDAERSATWAMGALAEAFRRWPGVRRSHHPQTSFAAIGPATGALLDGHQLGDAFGETSPIGRLYALDGHVLLLGVGHGNNTSLHLAEYRSDWPGKLWHEEGAAMMVDGERRWQRFRELKFNDDDFAEIGQSFEQSLPGVQIGRVGGAESRLFRQRPLVDWAVTRMTDLRP
ncbi:MAG: AAC(3) family N-acetyltransferase [Gammaproteobacteria bacterium]|nr:AAC(3) family N-acetyltransferase [Gammaproteobacteria bacterium]